MGRRSKLLDRCEQRPEARMQARGGMDREICIALLLCTGVLAWPAAFANTSWRTWLGFHSSAQQVADLPEPGTPAWKPLDKECGIWHSRSFLSGGEIEHLLSLVNRTGGWEQSTTGGAHYKVPVGQRSGRFGEAVSADPVVDRIEQRIAQSTGIPVHPLEDMLSMASMTSMGPDPRSGHFVPFGLHHDSDTKPNRARTVLVYLSDTSRGGRTVFPLCGTKANVQQQQQLSGFRQQLRAMWGSKAEGYSRQASFDIRLDHPFNDLLADACRGEVGIGVQPLRGDAIMFDAMTTQPNGQLGPHAQTQTWHAGCNVLQGEKTILQKFKELELSSRNPADAYANHGQYQAYRPL